MTWRSMMFSKRNFGLLAILCIFLISFSSQGFSQGYFWAGSSSTEDITIADSGTVVDGTVTFNNYPNIAIKAMVCDTLSSDSAQSHIIVKYSNNSSNFAYFDTLTVSTDSTWFTFEYGKDEHPMLPFIQFSAYGDSLTSNVYNSVQVRVDGWYEKKN